ncbi:hypothetical protein [Ferruginibacter sp.]
MKYIIYVLAAICSPMIAFSQDITGLWKGTMYNDSTKQSLPYELVISKEKGKYTGYTHSWFTIDNKQYYGIKKVSVRIAKDGKVVIQDAELLENDYPILPAKNVSQLNVLDLAKNGDDMSMGGPFVTNRTREYLVLSGNISIKKVNALTDSKLMTYLQKNGMDNAITAAK